MTERSIQLVNELELLFKARNMMPGDGKVSINTRLVGGIGIAVGSAVGSVVKNFTSRIADITTDVVVPKAIEIPLKFKNIEEYNKVKEFLLLSGLQTMLPAYETYEMINELDDIVKSNKACMSDDVILSRKIRTYVEKHWISKLNNSTPIYKNLLIDKGHWSKIENAKRRPSRNLLMCFATVLKLDVSETVELCSIGGFGFSKFSERDQVYLSCIRKEFELDETESTLVKFNFEGICNKRLVTT